MRTRATISSQQGTITKRDIKESISGEQLKKAISSRIDKMYESRKQVITEEDIANGISGQELIAAVHKRIDQFADK